MTLPPYTVPEQDADLWGCGVVLSSAERAGADAQTHVRGAAPASILLALQSGPLSIKEIQVATKRRYESVRPALDMLEARGAVVLVVDTWSRKVYALPGASTQKPSP